MRSGFTFTALLLAAAHSAPAHAAESLDSCSGYIDRVPAVITRPGVWCLRRDLSANLASGAAIAVEADDVTIDCNRYKLGGLNAGPGTAATGIRMGAVDRTTVRGCHIRGFQNAIAHADPQAIAHGAIIEDNRIDGAYVYGILLGGGDGHIVRRNRITDTGGSTTYDWQTYAVYVVFGSGHLIADNQVDGVTGVVNPSPSLPAYSRGHGILTYEADGTTLLRNHVDNVSNGHGAGIWSAESGSIRANHVSGNGSGHGISCYSTSVLVRDNVVINLDFAVVFGCSESNNTEIEDAGA